MLSAMEAAFCLSAPLPETRKRSSKIASFLCCDKTVVAKPSTKRARSQTNDKKHGQGNKCITEVSVGDGFTGIVKFVGPANSSWVDIGVCTKGGKKIMARLRFSKAKQGTKWAEEVGSIISVYAHRVLPDSGRIEVRKGIRPVSNNIVPENPIMLQDIHVGDKLKGTVCAVGGYGAVVNVNVYRVARHGRVLCRTGLLLRKHFKKEWATEADLVVSANVTRKIKVGEELTVWVRKVLAQNALLLVDANPVTEEDVNNERKAYVRQLRKRRSRLPVLNLVKGERRIGTVTNIAGYGLFVNIGAKRDGLIHISRIPERYRRDWREFEIGEEVCVEITEIKTDYQIALNMIGIVDDILKEAREKANSPTARFEDVQRAQEIMALIRNPRPRKLGLEKRGTEAIKTEVQMPVDERAAEDEDVMTDNDTEAIEQFSDEYFEDRYGF